MIQPAVPSTAPSPSPAPRHARSWLRRLGRVLLALLGLLLLLVLCGGLWLRHRVTRSLPQLRGKVVVAGLGAPVVVTRDALGVPFIQAANRIDAARALGFLHAQDRFFQMDLLRREGAGEMSELVGRAALRRDRNRRRFRFRALAVRALAGLPPRQRQLVEAYSGGVNAGLAALRDKPFEYVLLGAEPRAWRPEDSLLTIAAMYLTLNDWRGLIESDLGTLHERLPAALFDFLEPPGSDWDAPLVGPALPTPPIPGADVFDLRKRPSTRSAALLSPDRTARPTVPTGPWPFRDWEGSADIFGLAGSNAWAVAGAHTADGHALLADDMHLALEVPNIWYRASWSWPGPGGERRVGGLTLPGMPALVVGSTGRIAWGFSNSFADTTDLVDLELEPGDAGRYRTPSGPRPFTRVSERIPLRGGGFDTLDVDETVWGPVVDRDPQERPRRALAWTACSPEALNLGLLDLEEAGTIDQAIEVAHHAGVPPQNFVVADASGRVGWTIMGLLPRRIGWSGRLPSSWADGTHSWDGWLRSDEVPKVVDPPSGRIWTANNRLVGGEALAYMGDGGLDLGARATQIRDRLLRLERATPQDLLALQLDDRALFLSRWRNLLLRTLGPEALRRHPGRAELRRLLLSTWTGRASIDSVAYRIAREFHDDLELAVFTALTGLKPEDRPPYLQPRRQLEGALWLLVTERPAHLLDPRFRSWDDQLLAVVDQLIARWQSAGPRLADRTWGERNTLRIQHPLSLAIPPLARWLDVPPRAISGDQDMPRVTGDTFGASERMVVSPGHEDTGILHMPVGESGHPLSPYYRNGQAAWEQGSPTPFLPGPAVEVLRLVPPAGPTGTGS